MEINGSNISNYGVLVPGKKDGEVAGLIEKPDLEFAPSNKASIGRYVLSPNIFEILRNVKPGFGNEIQLSDAINALAKQGQVEAVKLNGERFDCGVMSGYISAIINQYNKI